VDVTELVSKVNAEKKDAAHIASQAETERDDTLRQVEDLEKELEAQKKESQDALYKAKAKAMECEKAMVKAAQHEERLIGRVHSLAEILSSKYYHCDFGLLFIFLLPDHHSQTSISPRRCPWCFSGALWSPSRRSPGC
jgi:hypothetical protein